MKTCLFSPGIILLFFLCPLSPLILKAAGPVEHAYLSYRFFEHFPKYNQEERKEFMIGTLFADIRYLGETTRKQTHYDTMSLEEVLNEKSPFMAGLKFHSWVDIVRENFVVQSKIYSQIADISIHHQFTFLKLAEDEAMYATMDWQECCDWLKEVRPEELNWQMDEKTIRKWHNLLTLFFTNTPSTVIFMVSATKNGFFDISSTELTYWNRILNVVGHSPRIKNYVIAMNNHFEVAMRDTKIKVSRPE